MRIHASRWLAGVETGVWAGLAMVGWLALTAAWSRHSVWEMPDRLGTLFYGAGWRGGPAAVTVAGLALHLFASGAVGVLFAVMAREAHNRLRARLLGLVVGLAWYYLSYAWFWDRLLPPADEPSASLLVAYLWFGLGLGRYPGRLRSAQRHFLPGRVAEPGPEPAGSR